MKNREQTTTHPPGCGLMVGGADHSTVHRTPGDLMIEPYPPFTFCTPPPDVR